MADRDGLKPVPTEGSDDVPAVATGFSLSRERLIYWLLFLFCAVTRFLAMARSIWDWDEALFCLGMRAYDVTSHHPHPPGFPIYIGLAKLVRFLVHDDFRSLQAINLAAGMLVFPAVFMLARELRFRFVTAATERNAGRKHARIRGDDRERAETAQRLARDIQASAVDAVGGRAEAPQIRRGRSKRCDGAPGYPPSRGPSLR